jgi:hypothetical protein
VASTVALAGWTLRTGTDEREPIDVSATGPRFATLEELAGAADAIVAGTVVAVDAGRTITDPSDPRAGITTRLIEVAVTATFAGPARDLIVIEEEAALLDGTSIVVNGLEPAPPGTSAVWFLVAGDGEQFPYAALVNEQARIPLTADRVAEPGLVAAGIGLDELRARLRSTVHADGTG